MGKVGYAPGTDFGRCADSGHWRAPAESNDRLLPTKSSAEAQCRRKCRPNWTFGFGSAPVGFEAATVWAPIFPKYVLLLSSDSVRGLVAVMVICAVASLLAIRAALRVDPAEAIGG
ncbi:MAG: hypothetical protein PSV23_00980 [Brevundimonas sp.]|uniref:hypothetical protein n=1 Tax=Brevundimonas sp. TaxID=1871086 RepID=UPI0024892E5B|nr:hypothetical protein [Brevundimonas sp.]MDI1325355.1 hypothetical protein [Brevundimonas sp.]